MNFEDKLLESQLKLNRFLAETDYKVKQVNGCRILEIPDNINRSQIESESEIFVTNLPELIFEDTLLPMFSSVGKVYKLRLMLCFSGANKGYCYVQYMNSEAASRAVAELNGVEIEDRYLSVKKSINNCRLFFQNLPLEVSREDIEREFRAVLPEAMNIFVFADPKDPHKNRGFIFVEFETHRSAALARRKYCKGLKMFDRNIIVGWAVPEKQMDDVSQATDLFIRCIPPEVFENDIRKEIEKYLLPKPFFKVRKIKDFAFIHFDEHRNAEKVLKIFRKGLCIKGHNLYVMWANPEYMKQKQHKKQDETNMTSESENLHSSNLNQNSSKEHQTNNLNGRSSGRYEIHHAKEKLSRSCYNNPLGSAGAIPVNNNDYQCNTLVPVQFRSSTTQASMSDQFFIPPTTHAVVSDNLYKVAKQILKICNFKLDKALVIFASCVHWGQVMYQCNKGYVNGVVKHAVKIMIPEAPRAVGVICLSMPFIWEDTLETAHCASAFYIWKTMYPQLELQLFNKCEKF